MMSGFGKTLIITLLTPHGLLSSQPQHRYAGLDDSVNAAFTAPPELGADVLIRLVQNNSLQRKDRIELLVRAFEMAKAAKYPLRRVPAVGAAFNSDSDAGLISAALAPGLSALDLQSRVVRALLDLDRDRARRLFEAMARPAIPQLSCEDALGYSFDDYYATALAVMKQGYSPRELTQGQHVDLARDLLAGTASPFQLHGAMSILLVGWWHADELQVLITTFAGTLSRIAADDRSFTAGTNFSTMQAVMNVVARMRTKELLAFLVVNALRTYLVRHLSATRCAEEGSGPVMDQIVGFFNRDVRTTVADVPPITDEDRHAKLTETKARVDAFWETSASKELLAGIRRLRFGTQEQQARNAAKGRRADGLIPFLSTEQRSGVEWQEALDAFTAKVSEWDSHHTEAAMAYFREKCVIYTGLLAIVPDAARRRAVMHDLGSFLMTSPMRRMIRRSGNSRSIARCI